MRFQPRQMTQILERHVRFWRFDVRARSRLQALAAIGPACDKTAHSSMAHSSLAAHLHIASANLGFASVAIYRRLDGLNGNSGAL